MVPRAAGIRRNRGKGRQQIRKRIELRGTVQGVGFRPFVFNLASRHGLVGWVRNDGRGVTIEVEGGPAAVERFEAALLAEAPPLARPELAYALEIPPRGGRGFEIVRSSDGDSPFALVPPDIAACDACRRDVEDPAGRRFAYPFTNCTNCGPRYTIVEDVPYDRRRTTMAGFAMCPECAREYSDPADRRFHAEPNACPACGPHLQLQDRERLALARGEALDEVRRLLARGAIVAIKGVGGFHLACDAASSSAVRNLRERKRRTGKPFALMAASLEVVEACCSVSDAEREVLAGPLRPVVLLRKRPGAPVAEDVAPGQNTLGFMLPYTPLHQLLFTGAAPYRALVMTSGNISEEPIVSRDEEIAERLHPLCDYVLVHNRRIATRVDDSVVRLFRNQAIPLRRSRGYAPAPIELNSAVPQMLAVGGDLKNTFCLTRDRVAILSQHIGAMENYETWQAFRESLAHMTRFFRIHPEIVAHDLHPGYLSTRFALSMPGVERIPVQHHHAHIAGCAAEHGITDPVIGVAFDGTGFGADGRIWGGEFLVATRASFERRAHFRYVPMTGGDEAVRQPWRMAVSYLVDAFGASFPDLPGLAGIQEVALAAVRRGINAVETSSCGRLFDAVASLAGLRNTASYEGQAAMEWEAVAEDHAAGEYAFDLNGEEVDFREMTRGIVRDVLNGAARSAISARFHNTLAAAAVAVCSRIRDEGGPREVCLSGGCFANWRLLRGAVEALERAGFTVYWHGRVPPNDGGLSFGQAMVAASSARR